jgi:hypothetical protein
MGNSPGARAKSARPECARVAGAWAEVSAEGKRTLRKAWRERIKPL